MMEGLCFFFYFFQIPGNKGFLKPFLKGKILRSSERGVNSILTTILRFFDQLPEEIEFFA